MRRSVLPPPTRQVTPLLQPPTSNLQPPTSHLQPPPVTFSRRQLRLRVLEALERRAKGFRGHEGVWPFRIPHEPLALDALIVEALSDEEGRIDAQDLRSRTVLRMEWTESGHAWEAWTISLPSGILIYCDDDGEEARVLASVRRGTAVEADGFFLELLAETHGHAFGIEMAGD